MNGFALAALASALALTACGTAQPDAKQSTQSMEQQRYAELLDADWHEAFSDPCTDDWQANWQLDGQHARITQSEQGMDFSAGDTAGDDADHAVLWTRKSFAGDIRIEYDFTRLDDAREFVTILYVQATGSGEGHYDKDITRWADRRAVPAMRTYFDHMHTYHISYAAYDWGNDDPANDYIRARRYMPETGRGLEGTDLLPDAYAQTALFAPGVPHHITIIKSGHDLFMHITNLKRSLLCHWDTAPFPPITEGRLGLRHMYTRAGRYRNFRVWVK